jgi:hypothetical protein
MSRVLKLLVLGGATHRAIADCVRVDFTCVVVWNDLFFDIGDKCPSRRWLHKHVLEPEISNGQLKYAEWLLRAWHIRFDRQGTSRS